MEAHRLADYVAYVRATGVGEYLRTPGNQGAWILTRPLHDGRAELVAFSLWRAMDDVRRFAGRDENAMVLFAEDREFLVAEPGLTHYEVHPASS